MLFLISCNNDNSLIATKKSMANENEINLSTTIPDENISSFKERRVIAEDILIRVNDIIITKELPETVEKYKINYFDESCDENGTFNEEYQYVFLDLIIENKSDITKEIYLNSMLLSNIDDNNSFRGPTEEMRYRSGYNFEGISPKDYFYEVLEAYEIVDVTVGFIVQADFFDIQNSCLRINISGNTANCSEIKSIRLTGEE